MGGLIWTASHGYRDAEIILHQLRTLPNKLVRKRVYNTLGLKFGRNEQWISLLI